MPPRGRAQPRLSRDFWLFWASGAISNLGDGIRLGALPLLAATITREPIAVTIVSGLTMLPWLLFGPLGGALVDRTDRRRLIVAGQLGRVVAVAGLAILVATGGESLAVIYLVAFVVGLGEVVVDTATQAAIPVLAPSEAGGLETANARVASAQLVSEVVGSPVGALLFATSMALPFGVDAATFLAGAALVSMVRAPLQREVPAATGTLFDEVADGVRFVVRHPFLRTATVAIGLTNVAFSAAISVMVLLVVDTLAAPEWAYGMLIGVGALGGLCGSLLAGWCARRFGRTRAIVVPLAASTVSLAAVGLAPDVVVAALLFFVSYAAGIVASVSGITVRQLVTPDHLLGRVTATYRMIGYGGAPVGAVLGGLVGSVAGVRAAYAVSGLLGAIAIVLLVRAVRHLPTEIARGAPA